MGGTSFMWRRVGDHARQSTRKRFTEGERTASAGIRRRRFTVSPVVPYGFRDDRISSSQTIGASPFMIEVEGLTKLYDSFAAVQELSFAVRSGEVLGLVG